MLNSSKSGQISWWQRVLTGFLAIALGLCAVAFPGAIMFGRILDLFLRHAEPYSGSMTAVSALLAMVALVAVDGLVHLFGTGAKDNLATRLRGVAGVAIAIAAIFWPDQTAYVAVEIIGLWAILVGVLELLAAKSLCESARDRMLLVFAAIASVLMGVGIMIWVFIGAVVIGATVGIAATARGVSLVKSGFSERNRLDKVHVAT